MADAKLEIRVGSITFAGEGPETWLSEQLDKVISKLPELLSASNEGTADESAKNPASNLNGQTDAGSNLGTLAAYLKASSSTENQTRKFLATAVWLESTENKDRLFTADVTKALSTHKQGKLSNPAQCLINNVKAGHTVKEGKGFYVTDEGMKGLP